MSVKANVDSAMRKENSVRQALAEKKSRLVQMQAVVKSAQKNASTLTALVKKRKASLAATLAAKSTKGSKQPSDIPDTERASSRVKDAIAALRKTADRRRHCMNEKKSSSVWAHSVPTLSKPLKQSLWHKLHRRNKQLVILRPTEEAILNDLRSSIIEAQNTVEHLKASSTTESVEEKLIKAEQLFLLATHPAADDAIPSVPGPKSTETWGEPGWLLNLLVPGQSRHSNFVPCRPCFPVLEKNISEMASAPGRQAASLLRSSHFRCLASPLSAVGIASSPAENIAASVAEGQKTCRIRKYYFPLPHAIPLSF